MTPIDTPTERTLDDAERAELQEAAAPLLAALGGPELSPEELVEALQAQIIRLRARRGDHGEDAFALGALFALCLEAGLGFELVELQWAGDRVAIAAVELDRSLVILPLLAVDRLFVRQDEQPVLANTYARLARGERPADLTRSGYAVLLP